VGRKNKKLSFSEKLSFSNFMCPVDIDLGLSTWVRGEKLRLYRINTAELRGVVDCFFDLMVLCAPVGVGVIG
jgi:hypothetical protein